MDDQKLVKAIAADVDALDNKVRSIASMSHQRYRLHAKPGTVMRGFGEFEAADAEGREAIAAACSEALTKIMKDVDARLSAEGRTLSESARADDAATVSLTLSRDHVSAAELQALLDRYASNHQLASAICDRADRDGIRLDGRPDPVRIYREDAATAAARVLDRYSVGALFFSPEIFAEDVVRALRHIDVMGNPY